MAFAPRPKPLIILGTGGNCFDILDAVLEINDRSSAPVYECIGFLDDDPDRWGLEFFGVRVLGPLEAAVRFPEAVFVNGIGSERNFWRKDAIIGRTGLPPERFETIVHPTAAVSRLSTLGRGVVVLQNVTIASRVTVGDHVMILPNSVLSHDTVVGDYTSITGGVCISGNVRVGRCCYLGTNSAIIGNVTIGDGCLVGMGSVVLHSVEPNQVVVGNPARVLRPTRS